MKKLCKIVIAIICAPMAAACVHNSTIGRINFESESAEFATAVAEYQTIWAEDGARIIDALERSTNLRVEAEPILVIVFEGASRSGYRDIPMRLRASYPRDTKRATLVHELSHRLISDLTTKEFEDHPVIFLFLYDVWLELWGQEFANAQVVVESRRRGLYDYESAWATALAFSKEERAAGWREFYVEKQQH